MKLFQPVEFKDYQLIDCGNFEKLERFGDYTLIRPEPQAVWFPKLSRETWLKAAHAQFQREKQKTSYRAGTSENGGWSILKKMPASWVVNCPLPQGGFKMKLSMTSFGHIGMFPEQASNWAYIYNSVKSMSVQKTRILNLFAYTGGATFAANAAGADVTHLDAVKPVVNWSRENMELSGQKDIRWIVDDALKFLHREVKRGKTYHGIILDPPAYGRGPTGEKWVLEEGINELLKLCSQILEKNNNFLILNLYSLGFSSLIAQNLLESYFPTVESEFGEFYLQAKSGIRLPLGTFARFRGI
jgi:23S rRNA (cytosine1962-C5)-methyltransferase